MEPNNQSSRILSRAATDARFVQFFVYCMFLCFLYENVIYEGIPDGNVKLAYSEKFFMLNLIHSECSCGRSRKLDKQRVLPKKGLRLLTNLRLP